MANAMDLALQKMEKLGYRSVSESPPDEPLEADMASEDAADTWTGTLEPVQLSERRAFWWRPHRNKDDLWMEIMELRGSGGVKVKT
jgi:hypothetical protein